MKKLNKKNKFFIVQLKYITILNSICDTAPNTKIQIIIFIITEIECWPVFKQDPKKIPNFTEYLVALIVARLSSLI